MEKNKKGFTLIELVITVAIIIVLSTISVPLYKKHVLEARNSEGYALLGAIRDAQLLYFNEYRTFLHGNKSSIKSDAIYSCNEEVLGINATGNKYFNCFCLYSANSDCFQVRTTGKDVGFLTIIYNRLTGVTYQ